MNNDFAGELRLELEQLVDRFVAKGGKAPAIIAAMRRELDEMKGLMTRIPTRLTILF